MEQVKGNMQKRIEHKLGDAFAVDYLALDNESHMHNVPPNSETHFKLTLVSEDFEGLTQVKRHQAIYAVLADELANGVHALAIHTFTPAEWQRSGADVAASPACRGGSAQEQRQKK